MNTDTLKHYAKEFRDEQYKSNLQRSLFHFFKFLGLVCVFLVAQFLLLNGDLSGTVYVLLAGLVSFFLGLT